MINSIRCNSKHLIPYSSFIQLEQQTKKSSKHEKKQKKKKKYKQDVDSDDEAQLDMLLATKYKQLKDKVSDKNLIKSVKDLKLKRKKKSKKDSDSSSSELGNSSDSESSSEEDKKKHKEKKRNRVKESTAPIKKHTKEKYLGDVDKEKERKHKSHERHVRNRSLSRESNECSMREKRNRSHRSDEDRNKRKNYRSRSPPDRENDSRKNRSYDKSNIDDRLMSYKVHQKETAHKYTDSSKKNYREDWSKDKWNPKTKQLSEKEKERRRQEMMANATWRDKEREQSVKKYREEEKKEVDSGKVYNQDFVRKHLAVAAEIGTVASRIKSNINNIQRSGRAMDTNFAKR